MISLRRPRETRGLRGGEKDSRKIQRGKKGNLSQQRRDLTNNHPGRRKKLKSPAKKSEEEDVEIEEGSRKKGRGRA